MAYIDVDKLLMAIKKRHTVRHFTPTKEDLQLIDIFEIIKTQPTADVVEVPCRCGECKHYVANYCTRDIKGRTNMFYMKENDFCSYGERK